VALPSTNVHSPEFRLASESGRTCAVAGQIQRDVTHQAAAYGDLFDAKPFDAAMFGTLAMAIAFSAPWLDSAGLRIASRTTIWTLGLDWRIDYLARSAEEIDDMTGACLAVAAGADPATGDGLTAFLADVRDELATVEGFGSLRTAWLDELHRLLRAHADEWNWRHGNRLPTLAEYLANADNIAFAFVFLSHLAYTCDPPSPDELAELREAGREVQRVIRLLNDFASYERDRAWGDLNALMLDVSRDQVERALATHSEAAAGRIAQVRRRYPEVAAYLERQMGFCTGFYGVSDFWGSL
jgi:signal transduction histidine kinase